MNEVIAEIHKKLESLEVTPLTGNLVDEATTAKLLGYAPSHFSRLAAAQKAPVASIRRGNRRFYKIYDIALFLTESR